MQSTMTEAVRDQETVREVLAAAKGEGRTFLTAPEAKRVCDAYGITVPAGGPGHLDRGGREPRRGHRLPGRPEDRLAGHPAQDRGRRRARRARFRRGRRHRLRGDRRQREALRRERLDHRRAGPADARLRRGGPHRRRHGSHLRARDDVRPRRRPRRGAARRHVPPRADVGRGGERDDQRHRRRGGAARRARPAGRRPAGARRDDRAGLHADRGLPRDLRGRPQPGARDAGRRDRRRRAPRAVAGSRAPTRPTSTPTRTSSPR